MFEHDTLTRITSNPHWESVYLRVLLCTLYKSVVLDKPGRYSAIEQPDFVSFEIPNWPWNPCARDHNGEGHTWRCACNSLLEHTKSVYRVKLINFDTHQHTLKIGMLRIGIEDLAKPAYRLNSDADSRDRTAQGVLDRVLADPPVQGRPTGV